MSLCLFTIANMQQTYNILLDQLVAVVLLYNNLLLKFQNVLLDIAYMKNCIL